MSNELWTAVDEFLTEKLVPQDEALEAALTSHETEGLPPINVTPAQGKFLHLMAEIRGARRVLEIGTLGGYSTIWMARALPPEGRVVTLELEERHARVARANLKRAGVDAKVDLRLGPALASLKTMQESGEEPFDLIFIDADKENMAGYLEGSLRLSRPGTVIVADNVIREGEVLNPEHKDARVQGVRRFFDAVSGDPRLEATALQTVGSKKWDGFCLVVVKAARL